MSRGAAFPTLGRAAAWIAACAAALLVFARPHEDIFGGEDPGSYINSAAAYASYGRLFHVDPMLARVPPEMRPAFFYGHSQYGATKDACLWVRDVDRALVGPHFQPAYPVMMSAVISAFGPRAALYVTPIFALLCALALAAVAAQCLPSRAAPAAAALFFLANPLTAWHGRCPRAEIIAAFFLFAGGALLLNAWKRPAWRAWRELVLGALCLCAAPFFHVSSWPVAGAAALAATAVALIKREDYSIVPVLQTAGLVAFAAQGVLVTDLYRLTRFFAPAAERPALWGCAAAGGLVCFFAACFYLGARRRKARAGPGAAAAAFSPLRAAAGIILVVVFPFVFFFRSGSELHELFGPVRYYVAASNFTVLADMASPAVVACAFCGWLLWTLAPGGAGRLRAVVFLVLAPALLFSGRVVDFMTTRYFMTALVPALALGMAAIPAFIAVFEGKAWRIPFLACVAAIGMALAGMHGRSHFFTIVEHKGLVSFLGRVAELVRLNNGILLAEYSRIAAPLEHFFGLPALGLDNNTRRDYSAAEEAWETVMASCAPQPAFFLTPFQPPISDRFDFIPEYDETLRALKLQQRRTALPVGTVPADIHLRLYRMRPRAGARQPLEPGRVYAREFDAGNMGIRSFGNMRSHTWRPSGLILRPEIAVSLPCPDAARHAGVKALVFLFHSEMPDSLPPEVETGINAGINSRQWLRLPAGWRTLCLAGDNPAAGQHLSVTAKSSMLLADLFFVSDAGVVSLADSRPDLFESPGAQMEITSRWSRPGAKIFMPGATGTLRLVLALALAPDACADSTAMVLSDGNAGVSASARFAAGKWQWRAALLPGSMALQDGWIEVDTSPVWRAPGDFHGLGAQVSCLVLIPVM